jgi:hypothetical protein
MNCARRKPHVTAHVARDFAIESEGELFFNQTRCKRADVTWRAEEAQNVAPGGERRVNR